jgi:hypothetical protein
LEEKVLLFLAILKSQSLKKTPIISLHLLPLLYEDENVNGRDSRVQSEINKSVAHLLLTITRYTTLRGLFRFASFEKQKCGKPIISDKKVCHTY